MWRAPPAACCRSAVLVGLLAVCACLHVYFLGCRGAFGCVGVLACARVDTNNQPWLFASSGYYFYLLLLSPTQCTVCHLYGPSYTGMHALMPCSEFACKPGHAQACVRVAARVHTITCKKEEREPCAK